MITKDGYSKDKTIPPVGIAITWTEDLIKLYSRSIDQFKIEFEKIMNSDAENVWLQMVQRAPRQDEYIQYVYIIINNLVCYRANYLGFQTGYTKINVGCVHSFSVKEGVSWPRVVLGGPVIKPKEEIIRPGFQGFRYTTELF